jgi:hypothetical protein
VASHCIDRPVRVLVVCAVKLFRDSAYQVRVHTLTVGTFFGTLG